MKKVISITLSGRLFMIEEDAVERLSRYLDSIKHHYGPDGREICEDIETNIADKFGDKKGDSSKAISLTDVDEVIGIMGTVEQMEENDETSAPEPESKTETYETSGEKRPRRLYRDNDKAILGGVCTGLAAYFAIDVVIVRIIFVALTILNGIGILVYLVMWIIVPEAKTSVEKLEMQGEPVNLKNIEEVVKEKAEQAKENAQKAYVSLRENNDSVLKKILNVPIVIFEVFVKLMQGIGRIIGPLLRYGFGIIILLASFFTFIFFSFSAALLLFRADSPLLKSDFPLVEIIHSKAFIVSVVSTYTIALVFIVLFFLLAIGLMAKRSFFNWTIAIVLFALVAVNTTLLAVFGFDLAVESKGVYDRYLTENMTEKSFDFQNFNALSGHLDGRMIIERGDKYSVVLSGLKRDIDDVSISLGASTSEGYSPLLIDDKGMRHGEGLKIISRPLVLRITMPAVSDLDASGFWGYQLKGFDNEKDLQKDTRDSEEQSCLPLDETIGVTTDFDCRGRISKRGGANGENLFLVYESEDGKKDTVKLRFEERSICGSVNDARIVCMALSVSDYGFGDGQEAQASGVIEDGVLTISELLRVK